MIIEKNILCQLVSNFITNNCDPSFPPANEFQIKTFLKKDENNCFTIVDKEHCIKCMFDKEYLREYFSAYPSYTKIEQYEGMLIMINKANFDVLFYKNINKTISYRIVLVIKDFDLDSVQKMSQEAYNAQYTNVNLDVNIEKKITDFYYNFLKTKAISEANVSNHLSLNAQTFITKNFNPILDYKSVYKVLPKGVNFSLLNDDISLYSNLTDDRENFTIKEIEVKNNYFEQEQEQEEDNITVENMQNLDFKSLFYKNPSQVMKESKDFSRCEKIDLVSINKGVTLVGNKRPRKEDELENMPDAIKFLIEKMAERPPLTADIFEKYKNYRKCNSNEYIREKPN